MSNLDNQHSKAFQEMLTDAARAEEMWDVDELERYADEERVKRVKAQYDAKMKEFERLKAFYLAERHSFERLSSRNLHGVQLPHHTATQCLNMARERMKYENKYEWDYPAKESPYHGEQSLRTTTITRGAIRFEATILSDNDGVMLDDLGTLTVCNYSDWEDRAKSRPSREAVWVDFGHDRDSQGWFESEYGYDERRKDYAKLGRNLSHEAARLMIRRDAKRFEGYYKEDWQYVGVKVIGYVGDIEIGDATLWGIDWTGDQDYMYVNNVVDEQISEIYYSALDNIETEARAHIDKFASLILAADTLLTVNRTERNEWLEKLMDYSIEVAGTLPKPDDGDSWGHKD